MVLDGAIESFTAFGSRIASTSSVNYLRKTKGTLPNIPDEPLLCANAEPALLDAIHRAISISCKGLVIAIPIYEL